MATYLKNNRMPALTNLSTNNIIDEASITEAHIHHSNDDTHSYNGIDDKNDSVNNEAEEKSELDIIISNVVCAFSVGCHLNLRQIALNGSNVNYERENGLVRMKLRKPHTTAAIYSSGKVTCSGATSEDEAKMGARRYARCLQRLGFKVKFKKYRVVNVLGTCTMPWAIRITSFSSRYKNEVEYEPELHPGATYKLSHLKATVKIFSTGSVTVLAPSISQVQMAIEHVYPLVYEFRKERSSDELRTILKKKRPKINVEDEIVEPLEENENAIISDDDDINSDSSW